MTGDLLIHILSLINILIKSLREPALIQRLTSFLIVYSLSRRLRVSLVWGGTFLCIFWKKLRLFFSVPHIAQWLGFFLCGVSWQTTQSPFQETNCRVTRWAAGVSWQPTQSPVRCVRPLTFFRAGWAGILLNPPIESESRNEVWRFVFGSCHKDR